MYTRKILTGIALIVGLLPTLAHAELTYVGPSATKGQGFGNVINVLTLQQTPSEAGSVAWMNPSGPGNYITGTTTSGCPANTTCVGPDTGASNNVGKTSTQTFGTVGWANAASMEVSLNLNQIGSAEAITLQTMVMTVYSPTGAVLFTAPLDQAHPFPTIEQGTGTGYYVFDLTAAEQNGPTGAQALLFGPNYNPLNRVGLSASLDSTSNDGAETFGVVNGNVVPEPGFYGALALGLSGLCFAVQRSRRKKTL
jgi:hypothetical protein